MVRWGGKPQLGVGEGELAARSLRCYAEGRDGDWEAICLDLDIAVQGRFLEDVFGSLQAVISLHLETVAELPADQRPALLHRPVPLPVRLKYLTRVVRGLFSGGDDRQRHQFTMPEAT